MPTAKRVLPWRRQSQSVADDISLESIAEEVLLKPPLIGCLTVSNALQWRLQYSRAIDEAGALEGVVRVA